MKLRISICVNSVYAGRDFVESIYACAAAGVKAIDMWSWRDQDMEAVGRALAQTGIQIAAMSAGCSKMVTPQDSAAFAGGIREAIAVADRVGCKTLIAGPGDAACGLSRGYQHDNIVSALKAAAPILADAGKTLVLEPLNTAVDHPKAYLWSSDEAYDILNEVDQPHIKMLYDIYHQQIMEGNVIARIRRMLGRIGHFHAAGVPGRHELDGGELNYTAVLDAIRQAGYAGFVGLEYYPSEGTAPEEGFTPYLQRYGG